MNWRHVTDDTASDAQQAAAGSLAELPHSQHTHRVRLDSKNEDPVPKLFKDRAFSYSLPWTTWVRNEAVAAYGQPAGCL